MQCCVTSPPYWGLRDYGHEGQLGLERTPEEYVARMVAVFREVRRVLRDDGTLWLNIGDSYASDTKGSGGPDSSSTLVGTKAEQNGQRMPPRKLNHGLKPKDLCGIPWRVAFALQADGWYLRSDIIWSKPNPMPESVTDRPTKAHEYLFLLSKSARYYFDQEAVKEAGAESTASDKRIGTERAFTDRSEDYGEGTSASRRLGRNAVGDGAFRNLRTVWSIATQPYSGAHFAVMPPALVEPCIKAGTSERGGCPECGAGWERVATGWRPTCKCRLPNTLDAVPWTPKPCTVLDPFAGAGTVGLVALRLGRAFVGCELNPAYAAMARARLRDDAPLYNQVS